MEITMDDSRINNISLILEFATYCHSLPSDWEGGLDQESIKFQPFLRYDYIDSRLRGNDKIGLSVIPGFDQESI